MSSRNRPFIVAVVIIVSIIVRVAAVDNAVGGGRQEAPVLVVESVEFLFQRGYYLLQFVIVPAFVTVIVIELILMVIDIVITVV